jgi:hypothetical protein
MNKSCILPTQCNKIVISTFEYKKVFNVVKDNIGMFCQENGNGVVLLVYSVLLTKGLTSIISDMDIQDNALLTEHGYASQELINIMLIGKASSNVFNGEKDMGDNFILKGIPH